MDVIKQSPLYASLDTREKCRSVLNALALQMAKAQRRKDCHPSIGHPFHTLGHGRPTPHLNLTTIKRQNDAEKQDEMKLGHQDACITPFSPITVAPTLQETIRACVYASNAIVRFATDTNASKDSDKKEEEVTVASD